MIGELTTIAPDGTMRRKLLTDPEHYDDLRQAVGGDIDLVPQLTVFEGKPCFAHVNGEGHSLKLTTNRVATELWWDQIDQSRSAINALGMLHGPLAVVTGDAEFMRACL